MENHTGASLDLLLRRRSIRTFTDEPIGEKELSLLLMAGCSAPSAKALYPCHFVVVSDQETKTAIMSFHSTAQFLTKAPLGIVVCGDVTRNWACWRDDCAAATLNMIYAGELLGLSSCWCAVYPRDIRVDGMKKTLSLPAHIIPYSLVVFGHGAVEKERRERFDETCVHRGGRW